ncbi:D-glycerate 3-kinase, chloroplastic-like protein [Drosera capensis]
MTSKCYRKIATLSIEDFYLTAEDQAKLREANPENRLLELHGNAGSHDVGLSVETLSSLTKLSREGSKLPYLLNISSLVS